MENQLNDSVSIRYHIYNSLFLNLPFKGIYRTGTLLPLLQERCEAGYTEGKDPRQIINGFFVNYTPQASKEEQTDLLFNFIQYLERQVVLFDSIEDAAFEQVNEMNGKGSVFSLLLRAADKGVTEELKAKLQEFSVRIVLTAHPTQFYPGNVLAIINDLQQAIYNNKYEHVNVLLRQLGKTAIINKDKPTPYNEAVSLSWYLENVFYSVVPEIIHKLCSGLNIAPEDWHNYDLIKIGFWPGGDRDGNPFVTHETTWQVAQLLKQTILRCFHRDLRFLKRRLTFKGVDAIIAKAESKVYPGAYGGTEEGYNNAEELLTDLQQARTVLVDDHDGLFLKRLDEFILKVKMFRFYFASIDIRQHSRKHEEAWDAILGELKNDKAAATFAQQDAKVQVATLLGLQFDPLALNVNEDVAELLNSIAIIGKMQAENGVESCHRYIISNCGSALDVIRVFQLARLLIADGDKLHLDIVPLFETIEDLDAAPAIMEELYSIPIYKEHLQRRGNKQTIMLGFSDGTKDGGYLRANWSIFQAKENLTSVSRENGFTAIFFDGRGGPPARGGGNTHDFYASLGDTIEDKEVQITIQGQTISSNFGNLASCRFNVEQLLSAGVENEVFKNTRQLTEEDIQLLNELADEGYKAYLDLKHDPKFVPYLEKITPLEYFGETNIGSRPVKRSKGSLVFEDLRAIPFVGSWAQMKQNIPGFYGIGVAINQLVQEGKLDALKQLYKKSLFFQTLLGNSMMSLIKSYYPATAYLADDKEFGAFWNKMYAEFQRSTDMILAVTDFKDLMQNMPKRKASVQMREKIVLPLVTIQQFALQQLRDNEDPELEKKYRKLVLRCMFGIINAARNSA